MKDIMIRRAAESDIPVIDKLLYQVHKIHSDIRPDLFNKGTKKYTDEELKSIIADDLTPVFVAEIEGRVLGYAFCIHQQHINNNNLTDIRTLYIDDLCVDEASRGMHVGRALYDHVISYARENGYYNVTLNVWAGNDSAMRFYESVGLKVQKVGMEKIL